MTLVVLQGSPVPVGFTLLKTVTLPAKSGQVVFEIYVKQN